MLIVVSLAVSRLRAAEHGRAGAFRRCAIQRRMIVMESRHGRRFVVRIERGEDVVATLKKLAQSERVRAAWVRGTGLCEWVEITDWDPSREALRAPRHLEGPLALLACEGNVSMRLGEPYVELRAALSREGDAGLVLVGGQLVIASALNVELVVEVFEDVRLDRDEERETGLSVWKGERTPGAMARPTERRPSDTVRTKPGLPTQPGREPHGVISKWMTHREMTGSN
ncbi:MAG: DNA-binding protein, partial [Deltaproteobacteria bacterium]|nr:DNA-binding protein [Deltaproteobacteria bacterium]